MQIRCPDCNKEISHEAPHCPHCGKPMSPDESEKAIHTKRRGQLFGLFAMLCVGVGVACYLYFSGYFKIS